MRKTEIVAVILALALLFLGGTWRDESVSPPQAWGDPDWEKIQSPEIYHPEIATGNSENRSPIAQNKTARLVAEYATVEGEKDPEMTYLGRWYITGYDVCPYCCGKVDGITASGTTATVGRTCAAAGLPFGTVLYIDGIGYRTVEDRGGMGAEHIDVLCSEHAECYSITGYRDVWVVAK